MVFHIPNKWSTPIFIAIGVLLVASSLTLLMAHLLSEQISDTKQTYMKNASYVGFSLTALLVAVLIYDLYFVDPVAISEKSKLSPTDMSRYF
jgi:hypothetical protein